MEALKLCMLWLILALHVSNQILQTTNYLHARLIDVFGHEFLFNSLGNWGFLPNFTMATWQFVNLANSNPEFTHSEVRGF